MAQAFVDTTVGGDIDFLSITSMLS
jgi:hypothetical protein